MRSRRYLHRRRRSGRSRRALRRVRARGLRCPRPLPTVTPSSMRWAPKRRAASSSTCTCPGRSGLDILKALDPANFPAPIFMISGQGDIPMAVERDQARRASTSSRSRSTPTPWSRACARRSRPLAAPARRPATPAVFPGADLLTPREREVLREITAGASNKEAGRNSASARARSRCTAPASWRSSAPATPPTSCGSC